MWLPGDELLTVAVAAAGQVFHLSTCQFELCRLSELFACAAESFQFISREGFSRRSYVNSCVIVSVLFLPSLSQDVCLFFFPSLFGFLYFFSPFNHRVNSIFIHSISFYKTPQAVSLKLQKRSFAQFGISEADPNFRCISYLILFYLILTSRQMS